MTRCRPGRCLLLRSPGPARKCSLVITAAETQAILDACTRLRDRLLFALLHGTGMRIGEALGLRHEDLAAAEREVTITPRVNDNQARSKSGRPRTIPIGGDLLRLYAHYLHEEYRDLDSDYVFVNLWSVPVGQAFSCRSVYDLVRRLRQRTGIDFDPHWMRHSAATRMLRDGVPVEVVSALLGHASVTTGATVTTTSQALEGAGSPALLAKLMAAVRPEFRADPLTFAAPEERSAAASSPADPICVDGRSPDWSP